MMGDKEREAFALLWDNKYRLILYYVTDISVMPISY